MKTLESLQDLPVEETSDYEENQDWNILLKIKKGTEKTNNLNIDLLTKLNLEKKIFDKALYYFQKTLEIVENKVKFKNSIMCAAVYLSMSFYKEYIDEESLLKYFDVNIKKYTYGLTLIKTCINEVRYFSNIFDNYMLNICSRLNITKDVSDIIKFIDDNKNKFIITSKKKPKKLITCVFIYLWIIKNKNLIPSIESFTSLCEINKTIFKSLLIKNIFIIDNFLFKQSGNLCYNFLKKINTNFNLNVSSNIKNKNKEFIYFLE